MTCIALTRLLDTSAVTSSADRVDGTLLCSKHAAHYTYSALFDIMYRRVPLHSIHVVHVASLRQHIVTLTYSDHLVVEYSSRDILQGRFSPPDTGRLSRPDLEHSGDLGLLGMPDDDQAHAMLQCVLVRHPEYRDHDALVRSGLRDAQATTILQRLLL